MAKQVTVAFIDDVDSNEPADETVEFGIDGVTYEIDLSAANAQRLRSELDTWAAHARKVQARRRPIPVNGVAVTDRNRAAVIRDWARRNGHGVSARGRVSGDIVELYNAAH